MMMRLQTGLRDWLAQRTARERVLLGAAVALAAVWLVVFAVWQPLLAQRAALADRIARHDRGLAALAAQGPSDAAASATPAATARPVPELLTAAAATFQLVIRRLEAEGAGARVVLEEAAFAQVILWLEALERDHGLRVADIEMTRRPAPGMVGVTLSVER